MDRACDSFCGKHILNDFILFLGDTQSRIAQESQQMQLSLSRFSCGIQTLVEKTMQDSQQSSARLQQIRLEYRKLKTKNI